MTFPLGRTQRFRVPDVISITSTVPSGAIRMGNAADCDGRLVDVIPTPITGNLSDVTNLQQW